MYHHHHHHQHHHPQRHQHQHHQPQPQQQAPNMQPYQMHNPYDVAAAAAAAAVMPTAQMQLVAAQQAEEMRKSAKRAANRRSASTCRQRRKFFVENMADANERMRKRARVLSLLPDMILAMRRDGVITYASENCRQFLQFTREVGSLLAWLRVLVCVYIGAIQQPCLADRP